MFESKIFKSLKFFLSALLFTQQVFAYTFYVETSEFNDDVYIIENVLSDESTNESNKKSEELELINQGDVLLHFLV